MQNLKKIVQNTRGNYVAAIKGHKHVHSSTYKTNLKSNQPTTTKNLPTNIGTNLIEIIDNKLKSGSALQTKSREDMFTCEKCGTCLTNSNDLTEHKKKHIEYNPYYCAICNKSFEYVSNLRKHVSIHLRQGNYYRIESLKCARCKTPFPTLRDLAHHYCTFKQEVIADSKVWRVVKCFIRHSDCQFTLTLILIRSVSVLFLLVLDITHIHITCE